MVFYSEQSFVWSVAYFGTKWFYDMKKNVYSEISSGGIQGDSETNLRHNLRNLKMSLLCGMLHNCPGYCLPTTGVDMLCLHY